MRDPRDIALFAGSNRHERSIIGRVGTPVEVRAGTPLIRQGRPNRQFSVVLDGEVQVTRHDRELCRLRAGEWFGELAMLTDSSATATVTAVRHTTLLALDGREFAWLCGAVGLVDQRIREVALRRLRDSLHD